MCLTNTPPWLRAVRASGNKGLLRWLSAAVMPPRSLASQALTRLDSFSKATKEVCSSEWHVIVRGKVWRQCRRRGSVKKWTTVDVLFPVVFSSFAVGIITGVTAYFGLYHIYYYSCTTVNYAVIVPLSMVVAILAGLL